jgi:hypothetical protein
MPRALVRKGGALASALLVLSVSGCISLVRTETGTVPPSSTVAGLQRGASLEEVLAVCGVPVQTLAQPDGLLLIYRERHYDFKRVGFEPAIAVVLIDFTGIVSTMLRNLKLVFEWGKVAERRLVVLFDEDDRLAAFAYRDLEVD